MRLKRKMIKQLLIISLIFLISGCSQIQFNDPSIKTHWIKKGEVAPFNGLLMNDYTYYKIRLKLNECGK